MSNEKQYWGKVILPQTAGIFLSDPQSHNKEQAGKRCGHLFRSAIFYLSEEQKKTAQELINEMNASVYGQDQL